MKKFGRFKASEMTVERFAEGFRRRLSDVPDSAAWLFASSSRKNRTHLEMYRSKHKGQRCFIMANGPSLTSLDLSLLEEEITFGLNRIYLLFDKLTFRPTYYVCINGLVLEQFSNEIGRLEMPKFLNWTWRHHFSTGDPKTMFIKDKLGLNITFARDLTKPHSSGGTVTYTALLLAYYMGFQEVILIGLDHSYAEKGTPSKTEVRSSERDQSHFHPDYFPKGSKWQLPDLVSSELAYSIARQAFEEDGRRIIDATPNGKCPVFERAEYLSLFG